MSGKTSINLSSYFDRMLFPFLTKLSVAGYEDCRGSFHTFIYTYYEPDEKYDREGGAVSSCGANTGHP
jgi:hypothetical protein